MPRDTAETEQGAIPAKVLGAGTVTKGAEVALEAMAVQYHLVAQDTKHSPGHSLCWASLPGELELLHSHSDRCQ